MNKKHCFRSRRGAGQVPNGRQGACPHLHHRPLGDQVVVHYGSPVVLPVWMVGHVKRIMLHNMPAADSAEMVVPMRTLVALMPQMSAVETAVVVAGRW